MTETGSVLGMWRIADAMPDRTAVVDPSGREVSYGELADMANAYANGLRSLGLGVGDALVMMLPNSVELVAVYFAAIQTGLYVVMANWHLVGPEVAYIIGDSGAKAFVAHERFAAVAAGAAERADLPATARFAVGDVPGFQPLSALAAARPSAPSDRTTGCADAVHLRHHRPSQGRAAGR